jgi:hypothetical protein
MFRKNKRSQQPLLISSVNELPVRSLQILKGSWAATFREEVFLRIQEGRFAVLYADCPSRPNVPVNVLLGLEILKSWFGWSDEELYAHFLFDLQVRYALCCDNVGEGDFDLRTLYYFRHALSAYALKEKVNLVTLAFADITDQQIKKFEVKTGMQRMDSTDLASNIADLSRLELLITVLQRLHRSLSEEDQARYREVFAPYIKEGAGQYTYRIKGKEAVWERIQQVGVVLHQLLQDLQGTYGKEAIYATAQRFFEENFTRVEGQTRAKVNSEIQAGCLQSVDDLEASYRVKNGHAFKGYVANLSETCDPDNQLQLVTQTSVAPNRTADIDLLRADVPAIQARMDLNLLVNDGQYVGPRVDEVLKAGHVEQLATALTSAEPDRSGGKLWLDDFDMPLDEHGTITSARCPSDQTARIRLSKKGVSFRLDFDWETCQACPFFTQQQCRIQTDPKKKRAWLRVPKPHAVSSQRRRRFAHTKDYARSLRPAIEATIFQLTHPFPKDKLPVRGLLRMTQMVLYGVLALNLRRIDRFLKDKQRAKFTQKNRHTGDSSSLSFLFGALFRPFYSLSPLLRPETCC